VNPVSAGIVDASDGCEFGLSLLNEVLAKGVVFEGLAVVDASFGLEKMENPEDFGSPAGVNETCGDCCGGGVFGCVVGAFSVVEAAGAAVSFPNGLKNGDGD